MRNLHCESRYYRYDRKNGNIVKTLKIFEILSEISLALVTIYLLNWILKWHKFAQSKTQIHPALMIL